MDGVKKLLKEQIEAEFAGLSSLKAGSDEKRKAVTDLDTLYKLRIEEIRAEAAHQEHLDRHELERDKHFLACQTQDDDRRLKEAQHKSINIDRAISIGVAVFNVVVPAIVGTAMHKRGLKFEEEGTITSTHNRNLFSKLMPNIMR